MILCGFGTIGLEVKAVQRESDSEQQTLGFLFESFHSSNEVILSHRISYHVMVYSGIVFGNFRSIF